MEREIRGADERGKVGNKWLSGTEEENNRVLMIHLNLHRALGLHFPPVLFLFFRIGQTSPSPKPKGALRASPAKPSKQSPYFSFRVSPQLLRAQFFGRHSSNGPQIRGLNLVWHLGPMCHRLTWPGRKEQGRPCARDRVAEGGAWIGLLPVASKGVAPPVESCSTDKGVPP